MSQSNSLLRAKELGHLFTSSYQLLSEACYGRTLIPWNFQSALFSGQLGIALERALRQRVTHASRLAMHGSQAGHAWKRYKWLWVQIASATFQPF